MIPLRPESIGQSLVLNSKEMLLRAVSFLQHVPLDGMKRHVSDVQHEVERG